MGMGGNDGFIPKESVTEDGLACESGQEREGAREGAREHNRVHSLGLSSAYDRFV